jgi:ABC-type nitrate/sulfonate/bicarbonate transport system permease component
MRLLQRTVAIFALPLILLAVWWFASADSGKFYQPPLRTILQVLPKTWLSDRFTHDVLPSLGRLAVGYLAAVVLGIALGVLIGSSRNLRALVGPVLEFLRAIPPPVLVPILILFAGIDNLMKIIVIISGAVWPVLLNTVAGVRATDEVLADTCRSYRIGGWLRLRRFVLPASSPQIVTGARQALSLAIILMVVSELKAASSGLGYSIVQFQRGFEIPEMWSGVLVLGLIGVVLSLLFRVVERWVLRWYHGVRAAERAPL